MNGSKSTEDRKREIIEAAKALFFHKGYEQTSTTDIMHAVGIAKGTLYYHFASKEDILDAMIEDITDKMLQKAQQVLANKNLSTVDKMVSIIGAISMDETDKNAVMDAIHLPVNALLHQKSYQLMLRKISPIMLSAVKEGIDQTLFDTKYPETAVDMAMLYALTSFDENVDKYKIKGFIYSLEKILGAKEGALDAFYQLF